MKRFLALVLAAAAITGQAALAQDSETQRRADTLRYGIESQVVELLGQLKGERNKDFLTDILSMLSTSGNAKIREAALDYFTALSLPDAASQAAGIIELRDRNPDSTVGAAFNYLIAIKSGAALVQARDIIAEREERYLQAAIKLLGHAGTEADVAVLQGLWDSDPAPAARQELLLALGRMKAHSAYELLAKVADSEDSGKVERMYACTGLGELGDDRAVPILARASQSSDPNVRAAALAALSSFADDRAKAAILQGLRDAHAAVRAAAVKASAGNPDAVPYLQYQARYDPEKSVREAAIAALGQAGTAATVEFLALFLEDAKNPAQYRTSVFIALVKAGSAQARAKAVLIAAQAEKDRAFFLGLARALVAVDQEGAAVYVAALLDDKDFSVRLGGIAWAERNLSRTLLDKLVQMAESDAAETVRKRAASAVEKIRSR